jgi:hypothetical protein
LAKKLAKRAANGRLRTAYASHQIFTSRRHGGIGFRLAFAVRGETATNSFGFTGPEIYPIDDQISLLHAADLDGDGLNDLIVVNNLRSKINLLYNQTGKTNRADAKPRANSKSTNCRPTRVSALIPFPPTSASPRWRWPT